MILGCGCCIARTWAGVPAAAAAEAAADGAEARTNLACGTGCVGNAWDGGIGAVGSRTIRVAPMLYDVRIRGNK